MALPKQCPVLLVSYFFPPTNTAGIFRILGFTKYLPDSNVRPVLLTASPASGREHLDQQLLGKVPGDLGVQRIGAWCLPFPAGRGILRRVCRAAVDRIDRCLPLDPYFLFGLAGSVRARRLIREHRFRVVVTSSPPHSIHLLGYVQKRYFGTPWVADFRDPVRPKPFPSTEGKGWDHHSLSEKLERIVVETADVTIANTPTNRAILVSRYPKCRDRIICIPNGFDPDDFRNTPIPERKTDGQERRMIVAYTGEIYEGMGDALWEGLDVLKRKDPAIADKLEVRIAGIVRESELRKIENSGLSDIVKYVGFAKAAECQKLLDACDVALFLLPKEGFSYWVPSKLYNYFGSRKYVLAIVPEGDASRIIEEVNAGVCIRPIPEKIAEAISGLVSLHRSGGMKSDYIIEALEKYTRSCQAKQLAEVIQNVIGSAE